MLKLLVSLHMLFLKLYTALPHDLIECTFKREEVLYLARNAEQAFVISEEHKTYGPRHEKTGLLHMRKQRRRSASR